MDGVCQQVGQQLANDLAQHLAALGVHAGDMVLAGPGVLRQAGRDVAPKAAGGIGQRGAQGKTGQQVQPAAGLGAVLVQVEDGCQVAVQALQAIAHRQQQSSERLRRVGQW